MDEMIPPIEENIPLPGSAAEAFPELSPTQELEMRANVIKLMSDLTGNPLIPNQGDVDTAKQIAKQMMEDPHHRPDFSKYQNETLAFLAGMVAQTNVAIVDDLADLKMYVVNKLIIEVENARDSKIRVAALSKLGEIDGVDAFKKRSEMTVKHQTMEEVEKELLQTLESIETKVIDVEAKQIVNDGN
jgi:hypothetical protein